MDNLVCPGCQALQRRVAELEAQVERLARLLEQHQRAAKRQAAPFAKGPPKPQPQTPGRKPGADYGTKAHRPPPDPEQVTQTLDAPLPAACPDCGSPVAETHTDRQYQVEIPRTPIHRPSIPPRPGPRGRARRRARADVTNEPET